MALQPLHRERPRETIRSSFFIITAWALWGCFISIWHLPFRLSIAGTAFVVLFGAFWWSWTEAMGFLLIVSLIYRSLSVTPSGLYFLSLFLVFAILRIFTQRFSIRSRIQLILFIFIIGLSIDIIQGIFIREVLAQKIFSLRLVFSVLLSAVLQSILAFSIGKPFIRFLEKR